MKSKSLSHALLITALSSTMRTTTTGTDYLNITGAVVDDCRPTKVGKTKKNKAQKKAEKKARRRQGN